MRTLRPVAVSLLLGLAQACAQLPAPTSCEEAGCGDGLVCRDGACGPCEADAECGVLACVDGHCVGASCEDGRRNGRETASDCGGGCGPCADGLACRSGADCQSGACRGGSCAPATCADGVANAGEVDVDCGGSCGSCDDGARCGVDADCDSGRCTADVCAAPACDDGAKNGDETAVDCGGSCASCPADASCLVDDDCASFVCEGNACAAPTCGDDVRNGDEVGVDCGGACGACGTGRRCEVNGDCDSGSCARGVCVAAGCSDGVLNREETGIDCGGACAACEGEACVEGEDCASGACVALTCVAPACDDLVQNGDERAIDCGGSCGSCSGETCASDDDCASAVCEGTACAAPSCRDGVRNPGEEDVDCGGPCAACAGDACGTPADCASGHCASAVCLAATCGDGLWNGMEVAIDCGGPCGACPGEACTEPGICASGTCSAGLCGDFACNDGVRNGSEEGIDCGGRCGACVGASCAGPAACASRSCSAGHCVAATCSDGERNGDELGVDCGGPCGRCRGEPCTVASSCASGICTDRRCAVPTCEDGRVSGDEARVDCSALCGACEQEPCIADVGCASGLCRDGFCIPAHCGNTRVDEEAGELGLNCGGACGACTDATCATDGACASEVCRTNAGQARCAAPACDDHIRNGAERLPDCGGGCGGCAGDACGPDRPCASGECTGGFCDGTSCDNGRRDRDETGVDCGGACLGCDGVDRCARGSQCRSGVCGTDRICAVPTCTDLVRNGAEKGVDCGGSCALRCLGEACAADAACANGLCVGGLCAVPSCSDGRQDGDETGVDCGGSCGKCVGLPCAAAEECASKVCRGDAGGAPVCVDYACDDGVKNGRETGIDCGGPACGRCRFAACVRNTDCASGSCWLGMCRESTCENGTKDSDETGIDCGGSCGACVDGSCSADADCGSYLCRAGRCMPRACSAWGRTLDDLPTCGGACGACTNDACGRDADCFSNHCVGGRCAAPSCFDGIRNGNEWGADCGLAHTGNPAWIFGSTAAAVFPPSDATAQAYCGACPGMPAFQDSRFCASFRTEPLPADAVPTSGYAYVCAEASCRDGARNQDETGVDCGGVCGGRCPGDSCASDTDCTSNMCRRGKCTTVTCSNGQMDSGEEGIDCGGICPVCPGNPFCNPEDNTRVAQGANFHAFRPFTGTFETHLWGQNARCSGDNNCRQSVTRGLERWWCFPNDCFDNYQSGDETGIDCGGSCLFKCKGDACAHDDECITGDCRRGVCDDPPFNYDADWVYGFSRTCYDQSQNISHFRAEQPQGGGGKTIQINSQRFFRPPVNWDNSLTQGNGPSPVYETGVDCGGTCKACVGEGCIDAHDCASGFCINGACVDSKGVTRDTCGGVFGKCLGERCSTHAECRSQACSPAGRCVEPSCSDGVLNGFETDVDCGNGARPMRMDDPNLWYGDPNRFDLSSAALGKYFAAPDAPSCRQCLDQNCNVHADCQSGFCNDQGRCDEATCFDGVRNGDETDVDCGGSKCRLCLGASCGVNTHCASQYCRPGSDPSRGVCAYAPECASLNISGGSGPAVGGDIRAGVYPLDPDKDGVPESWFCKANGGFGPYGYGSGYESIQFGNVMCSGIDGDRWFVRDDGSEPPENFERYCGEFFLTCRDGRKDGDETGVDCGGRCGGCVGDPCRGAVDCAVGTCREGRCASASFNYDLYFPTYRTQPAVSSGFYNAFGSVTMLSGEYDNAWNYSWRCHDGLQIASSMEPLEPAVDCGGDCKPCNGTACRSNHDCASGLCARGVCVDATGVTPETCGGKYGACLGEACTTHADCRSLACDGGVCVAPTCDDGVLNGLETDVDCNARDRVFGQMSQTPEWLASDGRLPYVLTTPYSYPQRHQTPGVNGVGTWFTGPNAERCGLCRFERCTKNADCATGLCGIDGRCDVPACHDGVKNGAETGVDCGGLCNACDGARCGRSSDCKSRFCGADKTCGAPTSCDGLYSAARLEGRPIGDGSYLIDVDGAGGRAPFSASCVFVGPASAGYAGLTTGTRTDLRGIEEGGYTLVQRTVWDDTANAPLRTGAAAWKSTTIGSAATGAYRLAGELWPALNDDHHSMMIVRPRAKDPGRPVSPECDVLAMGTVGQQWSASGALPHVVSVGDREEDHWGIFASTELSTATEGDARECVTEQGGVPWLYGYCCSQCPSISGVFDGVHPAASFAFNEYFASVNAQTCASTGNTVSSVQGSTVWFGLDSMEYLVR